VAVTPPELPRTTVLVADVEVVDGCVVAGWVVGVALDVLWAVLLVVEVALDDFPQPQTRSASNIKALARRTGVVVFMWPVSRRSLPGPSLQAAARTPYSLLNASVGPPDFLSAL
jgi:hypothetical protein